MWARRLQTSPPVSWRGMEASMPGHTSEHLSCLSLGAVLPVSAGICGRNGGRLGEWMCSQYPQRSRRDCSPSDGGFSGCPGLLSRGQGILGYEASSVGTHMLLVHFQPQGWVGGVGLGLAYFWGLAGWLRSLYCPLPRSPMWSSVENGNQASKFKLVLAVRGGRGVP